MSKSNPHVLTYLPDQYERDGHKHYMTFTKPKGSNFGTPQGRGDEDMRHSFKFSQGFSGWGVSFVSETETTVVFVAYLGSYNHDKIREKIGQAGEKIVRVEHRGQVCYDRAEALTKPAPAKAINRKLLLLLALSQGKETP